MQCSGNRDEGCYLQPLENWLLDPAEHSQQVEDVHIAHFTCSVQLEHGPCV